MNAKCLFSVIILLFFISSAFSNTCYRTESYCSQYDEVEFNCREENYNPYTCRVYGPYQAYIPKTCTKEECSIKSVCGLEYEWRCKTRTVYDTCYNTCRRTIYKYCCTGSVVDPICERQSSCGFSHYEYYDCNPYNCNPRSEDYGCGWVEVQKCRDEESCRKVNYDCSKYETRTGWHDGTCYNTRIVCDKATDYDKCVAWSDKEVAYECSNMKLESSSFSNTNIKIGDKVLAMFNLSDCSGRVNYDFYMKNFNAKGVANCGLNLIELTPNTIGTQIILLKVSDSSTSINKNLGTITVLNINGESDAINPFVAAAFMNNLENGEYDDKIIEWIKQGLSNEEIIKNLMLSFGAIGLAITTTQANKIKEYLDNVIWKKTLYLLITIKDFIKGFFLGSNEFSNDTELMGEFIGGLLFIGDLRDMVISLMSLIGLNNKEFDSTLFYLSGFGILLDLVDRTNIADSFLASLKTVWKSLPKPIKSNLDEFFSLVKNSDEMLEVYNFLKRIPVDKIALFFNSAHVMLRKTPLKYLEDVISLFLKLLKYGDDLTFALMKKCAGWQDAAKITKYLDDFGDDAIKQLMKNHSTDEIYELMMKNSNEIIQINTKLIQSNIDEINEAIIDLSRFDEGFQSYISEIRITDQNIDYYGFFQGNTIELAFGKGLSDAQAYELMIHEGGHAIIANSDSLRLNLKGYEDLQVHDAINKYFDESISHLAYKYESLRNQMQDVATNKLALINPNVDKNKWYQGYKEDYLYFYDTLDMYNLDKDFILERSNNINLAVLAEMKLVIENNQDSFYLDILNSLINNLDKNLNNDFNLIYKSYKNIFEGLK